MFQTFAEINLIKKGLGVCLDKTPMRACVCYMCISDVFNSEIRISYYKPIDVNQINVFFL